MVGNSIGEILRVDVRTGKILIHILEYFRGLVHTPFVCLFVS